MVALLFRRFFDLRPFRFLQQGVEQGACFRGKVCVHKANECPLLKIDLAGNQLGEPIVLGQGKLIARERFDQLEEDGLRTAMHPRFGRYFARRERLSRFVQAAIAEEAENHLLMAQGGLFIVGARFDILG